jgi:uncharacterized small protein (DUF1192 family)
MAVYLIHSAASAHAKLHDGLRCFAPLSILRVFEMCAEFSMGGGWNPRRGFRHDDLSDSLGSVGAREIARRIAFLRAAIHPPFVRDMRRIFEWWATGGWNPRRGFRHDDLSDSLGCIGACAIARRIALLRAAIHPPGVLPLGASRFFERWR